jgi:hypothetical protein
VDTSLLHFQVIDAPGLELPVSFPWAVIRGRIRQCLQELLAAQHADGCWFDVAEHRASLLSEWLIAAAFIPRRPQFVVADPIDELLSLRGSDGSWDTADDTLTAYLALVLHQLPDQVLRPTRDWLVTQRRLVPSARTRLLLMATGQMPHLTLAGADDLESDSDRLAAAMIMHHRPVEHPHRDAVINYVLRGLVQIGPASRGGHDWPPSSRRSTDALLQWIDQKDRRPVVSVLPILALHHVGDDRYRHDIERLQRELDEAIRHPNNHALGHPAAERETTEVFRVLIEAGLPLEHHSLAAADNWIWNRFQQAAADRHAATSRLAGFLLALAARPTHLADDRAFVMPHVWNEILERQSREGAWSSSEEITGTVLECLGCYSIAVGQPVVDDALQFLTISQTSRGFWSQDRPITATAQVIRGLLQVGVMPHSPMLQSAREALHGALPVLHQVASEKPTEGLVRLARAVDVLMAAEARLDSAMCDALVTLADVRPRRIRERAWVLRALAHADRRYSPEIPI